MSRLFGSENRKKFKPWLENKQMVDETTTEEKYKSYDDKKKHEAELWADLLKEPLLEYNKDNAEQLNVNYMAETDKIYKKNEACFYIIQVLRRLLPDKTMTVCTHTKKVQLSTLVGKTDDISRTRRALHCLRNLCSTAKLSGIGQLLIAFLYWLSDQRGYTSYVELMKALKKLKHGDLLTSLRKQCGRDLCTTYATHLACAEKCFLSAPEIIKKELQVREIS
ncbi:MAG: hypothetical protein IJC57_04330 [Clostridia bacterium]|nr:hypothetical protein [Clostridia bacterium]